MSCFLTLKAFHAEFISASPQEDLFQNLNKSRNDETLKSESLILKSLDLELDSGQGSE